MITIKCFAGIAEKLNKPELIVEKEKISVAELRAWLAEQYPEIKEDVERAMVAINEEFAEEEATIIKNDIVALIPPVSGG